MSESHCLLLLQSYERTFGLQIPIELLKLVAKYQIREFKWDLNYMRKDWILRENDTCIQCKNNPGVIRATEALLDGITTSWIILPVSGCGNGANFIGVIWFCQKLTV